MELPSSQPRNENTQSDKKKTNDGLNALMEQCKAVEEAKKGSLRRFRQENVTIDTISGQPLITKMWVTDEEYNKAIKKEKEVYKCEYCDKMFDKRQKMLLHARYHKK